MHIIKFDYSFHKGEKIPIIPILLKGRQGWNKIWAFVDSGATFTIFGSKVAEWLGLNVSEGRKTMVVVGDGGFIPVYLHRVGMKIENFELQALVGFSDKLGVGFNLLGRKDVFETFKVCFDDLNKVVTLEVLPKGECSEKTGE